MSTQPDPVIGSVLSSRVSAKLQIQDIALGLFDECGYDAVSVEDVAAAAGVSPRSVYRYFGTKEQLVVWDPMDARLVDNLAEISDSAVCVEGFISSVLTGFAELARRTMSPADAERLEQRMRLIRAVPALRAGELKQMEALAQQLLSVLTKASFIQGNSEVQLRLAAYHVSWGLLAIADDWAATEFAQPFTAALHESVPVIVRGVAAILVWQE